MDLWRHTPQWALRILIDELPAIEAAQLQRMAQAASFPWLKDEPRRALTRDLASLTAPAGTARGPDIAALMAAGDLDAAAAAMTALGIAVRRVETA